jgi:hypothetical protein
MTNALAMLARDREVRCGSCLLACAEVLHGVPVGIRCLTHLVPGVRAVRRCVLLERSRLCRALDGGLVALLAKEGLTLRERALAHLQLALSADPTSRAQAARSSACPERVQEILADDWWWEVRAALASNHQVTALLQEHLCHDESPWVRRALAENRAVVPGVLAQLARDPELEVVDAAVEHPLLPPEVLVSLAQHPAFEIRRSAAKRMDLPPEGAWRLLKDPSPWVRLFLAANPSTPEGVVSRLRRDPALMVRRMVRHRGDAWARLVNALAFGIGQAFEPTAVPPALEHVRARSGLPGDVA